MHTISKTNSMPSLKPTWDTDPQPLPPRAPDSPPREQHPLPIQEDEPLVPRRTSRTSVKKRSYEIDTGTPPSKKFKHPLLETPRLFSQHSILLIPEQFATSPAHWYPLENPFPSPQTPNHPSNQSTLPKATVNHSRDQAHTMPYNNTAIPPPEEITGAASLPC